MKKILFPLITLLLFSASIDAQEGCGIRNILLGSLRNKFKTASNSSCRVHVGFVCVCPAFRF